METTEKLPTGAVCPFNAWKLPRSGEYHVAVGYTSITLNRGDAILTTFFKQGPFITKATSGYCFDNYFHAWAYFQRIVQQEKSK